MQPLETLVKPGSRPDLDAWSTRPPETALALEDPKGHFRSLSDELGSRLSDLQDVLYAQHQHRLLVVLQGLDTSGKDGATRNVFAPISPQGLRVVPFKAPTALELDHDYLWRIHASVPGKGEIVVFNRCHYEEVLVARVQGLVAEGQWKLRYRHIVEFERMLSEEGVLILKFFLHISKDEQKKRLQSRLEEKRKHWKWDPGDLRDREYWEQYLRAYEDAMEKTSTPLAPWHIIPADKKWYRDWALATRVTQALEALKMEYPKPKVPLDGVVIK